MKLNRQKNNWFQLIFPSLLLTSILFLGACMTISENAEADSVPQRQSEIAHQASNSKDLPESVSETVLKDASTRLNMPTQGLRILSAEKREWSDGCLGLAEPDTFCTQVITPGWKVSVFGGRGSLTYRTNDSGSVIKLETSDPNPPFPPEIVEPSPSGK